MKYLMSALLLFSAFSAFSQTPKKTVNLFFTALNQKNADLLYELVADDLKLHSLDISSEFKLSSSDKANFINNIKSIAPEVQIEERIFDVQSFENETIAQVWAPYKFYVNGDYSHSGVNAFTMVKIDGKWLITSITDTRNRNKD